MRSRVAALLLVCVAAAAQDGPSVADMLARLEKLEAQNRALHEEIQELKLRLADAAETKERLDVQERRTEELAQSKVQSSQRLPISVTGMLLFNTFLNGRFNGAQEIPTVASANAVPRTGGGTARQTVLGLTFRSPATVLGADVNGSLYMDFFATPPGNVNAERVVSNNLNRLMRLRIATVEFDWGSTSLLVGQDKPIISPREPNSLAFVGVSPLTNAGNPWLWQPQARLEQRFGFGSQTELRAQVGVFQTSEGGAIVPEPFASTVESSRPGLQTRLAFRHELANEGHIEFAPGLHASTSHVAGTSVPSRVYSFDWSIAPIERLDFSGMFYTGQNTANLGTLRQGFTVLGLRNVIPIRSMGGWAQLSFEATPRWTLNVFGGQHDDRDRDLRSGGIAKNLAFAGNALYRVAPNVILGFEAMQVRTTHLGVGRRLNNHYDLAVAYQF